jgi:hypothetical protein
LNAVNEEKPKAEYERFEGETDFQKALDRLLEQQGREMRIFDPDLKALRLNSPERVAQLDSFLRGSRTRKIYVVVHSTDHLTRQCPRMLGLLKLFNHVIQINQTHEEVQDLQDAFMVLDAQHYLRRPVATRFRGAIGLNDETEALSMRSRFQEIWAASYPGVASTTVGL